MIIETPPDTVVEPTVFRFPDVFTTTTIEATCANLEHITDPILRGDIEIDPEEITAFYQLCTTTGQWRVEKVEVTGPSYLRSRDYLPLVDDETRTWDAADLPHAPQWVQDFVAQELPVSSAVRTTCASQV